MLFAAGGIAEECSNEIRKELLIPYEKKLIVGTHEPRKDEGNTSPQYFFRVPHHKS